MTTRFWTRLWRTRTTTSPRRRVPGLRVEQLDDRVAPVVGAFAVPPEVLPGQGLDGVVQITRYNPNTGTDTPIVSGTRVGNPGGPSAEVVTPSVPVTTCSSSGT